MLAIKLAAVARARRFSAPVRGVRLCCAVLAAAFVTLYGAANRLDPLYAVQTTPQGSAASAKFAATWEPWFAEWYYLDNDEILTQALNRREWVFDCLTPCEASIPIHDRLVILQAESLDYNALGLPVGGQEVMPFLNRLRDVSMFYRVRAMHYRFGRRRLRALNGVAGSNHANTYSIRKYPYENTTPQILARCGYRVVSFHGNYGEFYNRRIPFAMMGFDEILFREELVGTYGLPVDNLGVRDCDVLNLSRKCCARPRFPPVISSSR